MKTALPDHYIVAIGTSAGGVEALESFFDHTFPDGVSYVIIQHLSTDYQSRLAQIIGKHSKLEICEAQQGMPVEVNKVYVIPHNKYMTIRQGTLQFTNKLRSVAPHFTIDTFFKSLAAERGNKAIGVILTGTGTDGTQGIKAIHQAGGIVLVQDPQAAKYRDMPDSAISTGLADQVLAASAMPKAIESYVFNHPYGYNSFSVPDVEDIKVISLPDIKGGKNIYKLNLTEDIHEVVMHASGYAGVCLDKNMNIMHSFGDVSPYLLPKVLNFNLAQLLPQSLSGVFGAAVHRAIKYNERVVLKRIRIKEESPLLINVLIEPFVVRKTAQKLIVVLFSEDHKVEKEDKQQALFDHTMHTSEYIADMEAELKEARENLQLVFEKIETFNENRQSYNKELLSANEELQRANEEHGKKIKELTELNDDFNNYFRSNVNRQLYVDKDLLLKKFSPDVFSIINLKETDLGRPIDDITTNLKSGNLIVDLRRVLATGEILVRELQDVNGRWYQVSTMPYIRQNGSQQDGAIITFNDITKLKHTQEELDLSNESLRRINADLDNFVYAASHDLLGPLSTIEGLIYLIRTNQDTGEENLTQYNGMLDASMKKFKDAIKELASVGRIESEMLGEKAIINIGELLSDIKLSILDKITACNAIITENLEVEEIKFSRKNLQSILYNLITNALKFTSADRKPNISISTKAITGFIRLTVSDNGMGMSEDKISSVFTMYRRLNMHIEGQGTGLYLVKKIIDAAGGKIEISSEVDMGTSFTIFFKV